MRSSPLVVIVMVLLAGCAMNQQEVPDARDAHPVEAAQDGRVVTFGVIADIHGETKRAERAAWLLRQRGAEFILVPGDIANNEALRSGLSDRVPDRDEIRDGLAAIAKQGIPVLAMPGNHERRKDWQDALADISLSYPNVIDMARYRVFDGDDVDVISLPGYQIQRLPGHQFIPDDGYVASQEAIRTVGKLASGLDDTIILMAHAAGSTGSPGPSTTYSGEDVGDNLTTRMMRDAGIRFAVVGHIHEAAGIAARLDGTPIQEGQWADEFVLNAGTLLDWRILDGTERRGTAAIVTVEGDHARFEMVELGQPMVGET